MKRAIRYFGILVFVVLALFILLSPEKKSEASVYSAFNYQGKLLDNTGWAVADGNYSITFLIYDDPAAGSCLWTARGTCGSPTAKTIAVSGGIFSTMLGESGDNALPAFTSDAYYLEVRIDYSGTPQTLTPRKRIGSVPQALNANALVGTGLIDLTSSVTTTNAAGITVNSLTTGNGLSIGSTSLTSGALINLLINSTAAASNTQTGLKISTTGANGTAGQTTYGGYITNTHSGTTSTNVGLYVASSGGASNYAAIFNGGNVGINTVAPTEDLDVDGDAWIQHSLYSRATKDSVATVSTGDKTIYVDASAGSDVTGDGTVGNPYASITRGVQDIPDVMEHDYTIQLAAGTYREQVVINKSGSSMESDGTAAGITIKGNGADPNSYRITGADAGADTTAVRNFGIVAQGPFAVVIEGVLINYTRVAGIEALKSWTGIRNVNLSITNSLNVGGAILADKETLLDFRSGGTINITGNGDSTADMGIRFVEGAGGWLIADNTVTINIAEVQYGIYSTSGMAGDFKNADVNVSNTTKRTGTNGVHLQQGDTIHNLDLSVTNFDYGAVVGNGSYLDLDASTFTNVNTAVEVATNSAMDIDTTTFSSVTTKYSVLSGGVVDATGEATTAKMLVNNSGASTVADGASAVAFDFDTMNTLSTAGALLFRTQNAGATKFSVDKDGVGYFASNVGIGGAASGAMLHISPTDQTTAAYGLKFGTDTNLYRAGTNLLKTDDSLEVAGSIDWSAGNTIYVPAGGDIATYVASATAGDTLVLASGTYTVTSTITVDKALLIKGQGRGATTITTSTNACHIFTITASNVSIENLTLNLNGLTATTYAIYPNGVAGNILTGIKIKDVDVALSGTVGGLYGLYSFDASGEIRNMNVTGTAAGVIGYRFQNNNTAEAVTTWNVYNSSADITNIDGNSFGIYVHDNSATEDVIVNVFGGNYQVTEAGAASTGGNYIAGGDAFLYAHNAYFSATDYDIWNSTGILVVDDVTLAHNTTIGTITYTGGLVSGNAGFGMASSAVDIISALSTSTTDTSKGINISHTGAITGTGYGGYFSKTGASTTNVGLYTTASGGTANYGLYVDAGTSYFGSSVDWAGGNIIYVPIGGDINTYVTNATAGDTLVLAAGNYSISANINLNKAIKIKGQGIGATTITNATAGIEVFYITASNVQVSDLTVVTSADSSNSYGVYANGSGGDNLSGIDISNVNVVMSGASASLWGVGFFDASGTVRNVKVSGTVAGGIGFRIQNDTNAEAATNVYLYNCSVDLTNSSGAVYGIYVYDSTSAQDVSAYIYDTNVKVTEAVAAAVYGIYANGDNAKAYVYGGSSNATPTDYDLAQATSAILNVYGTQLVNNTSTGTITYGSYIAGAGISFNTSTNMYGLSNEMIKTDDGLTVSKALIVNNSVINNSILDFDGNNDYINLGDLTEFNSASSFTVSTWINQDVVDQTDFIFYKYLGPSTSNRVGLYTNTDGYMYAFLADASNNYGRFDYSTAITAERWHHVVLVYDGTQADNPGRLKIYVDGVNQTLEWNGTIPATTANLATATTYIGMTSSALDGKVKRFRMYSSALTSANVTTLYQGTDFSTNLVHYYKLDEGSGVTATDTGSNPVNGTISGATWTNSDYTGLGITFPTTRLSLAVGTTKSSGISFGNDTWIYRSSQGAVTIDGNPTTASSAGLTVNNSGVVSGTGYGGYFTKTGASTTNVGLYTSASGATNNYGLIVAAGNVGIGDTTPATLLEIRGTHSGTAANLLTISTDGAAANTDTGIQFVEGSATKVGGIRVIDRTSYTRMAFDTYNNTDILNIYRNKVGINTGTTDLGTYDLEFGGTAARSLGVQRHTTADTAGNNFTIQAGGATSGATNKNGGDLYLKSGQTTGTGTSKIYLQTFPAGSSGTADGVATTRLYVDGNGLVGINTTSPIAKGLSVNEALYAGSSIVANNNRLGFDGDGDYVTLGGAGAISELSSASAFTFSTWFNMTDADAIHQIFRLSTSSTARVQMFYDQTTNRLGVRVANGSDSAGYVNSFSTAVPVGITHHLAIVYDGAGVANEDRLKVYIDGANQTLDFGGTTIPATTADMSSAASSISYSGAGQAWDGWLANMNIWSSALSSANVTTLRQGGTVAGAVHSWAFNQGYGSTLFDSGSNPVNGTIVGATWATSNFLGIGTTLPTARLSLSAGTNRDSGLSFGNDTWLYRSAAGTLSSDGLVSVANGIANPTTSAYGLTLGGATAGTPDVNLYRSAADVLKTDDSLSLGSGKGLLFNGGTSGTITIQPAAVAGTYALTLPTSDGDANQYLKTDGNGVLTWADPGASGGGWIDDGAYIHTVTGTDNVGIRTSTPAAKLQIANVAFDYVYHYTGTTWNNRTDEAKTTRGTAYTILADNNDTFNVGSAATFSKVYFDIGTAAAGNTMVFEYSIGAGNWTVFTGSVTDGTAALTQDGTMSFTPPVDWATMDVNGSTAYWFRVSSSTSSSPDGTAYTTIPDDNDLLSIYGNTGDPSPSLAVDKNGQVILNNVGNAANFLSTLTVASGITGNTSISSSRGISTTSTDGLVNSESSAASAGTPVRYSPRLRWTAHAWNTTGGGSDVTTNFIAEAIPSSSTSPTAGLVFSYDYNGGGYAGLMALSSGGSLHIGGTSPQARLHITEATVGNEALRVETVATNDDPNYRMFQNRVATTDATVTTIQQFSLTAGRTYMIEARVVARNTGGSATDGASYVRRATYLYTVAGGTQLIGSVQDTYTAEADASWDCTITSTGSAVADVRVTGKAATNITWHSTVVVQDLQQ